MTLTITQLKRSRAMTEHSVTDFPRVINKPFLLPKLKGFKTGISITHPVWFYYLHWTDEDSNKQGTTQNIRERFQWLLCALQVTISKNPASDRMVFEIFAVPRNGESKNRERVQLEAITERDENNLSILTIRLAEPS